MKYLKLFTIIIITIFLSSSIVSAISIQQRALNKKNIVRAYINTINTDKNADILYPLCSYPVIVERGKNFTIKLKVDIFDKISVRISTAYEPVIDEIELKIKGIRKTNLFWSIKVNVPRDTPVELYNLTIVFEKNKTLYSVNEPRAVDVIDDFSDNFSFVQVTDFHIGDPRGAKENLKETIGWKAAKKAVKEINLLHPDFVIISGDLVFGYLISYDYKECYKILQLFDVPTFLCPGNHDGQIVLRKDGLDFWKKYFGPLNYSFNYGNYHFIAVNSYCWPSYQRTPMLLPTYNWGGYIDDNEIKWVENDLKKNENATLTFMFLHHNPIWETKDDSIFKFRSEYHNRKKLLSLIEKYGVDMVLSGHVHYDNVTIINGTIYITTTTTASDHGENAYWGYRLVKIKNDAILSYNYKEPKYSIPSYHINFTFIDSYTAVVENNLIKNITVLVKFFVPTDSYRVKNGIILMERKKDNMSEIYVCSNVRKESKLEIALLNG